MHELSIATEIFKIVQSYAPNGNAIAVGIRLGAWSCVQEESLQNSFRWVTDQTPFHQVRLEINRMEEIWVCSTCRQSFDQRKVSPQETGKCPWCGEQLSLLDDLQEMMVQWIELHDNQEA